MAKKNVPDGKKPPVTDTGASAKKRGGFISDFDMWDMNLDISSDDTIDPTVRSDKTAGKLSATQPVPPVESRAKTTPIQPRKTQQPAPQGKSRDAGQAVANRSRSKPVAGTNSARGSSQGRPAGTGSPGHNNPLSRTQPVSVKGNRPPEQRRQATTSQSSARASGGQSRSSRSEAAVFTTRDVNQRVVPQDIHRVEELKKRRNRSKFLKSISWLWTLMVRIMPVLYRHKTLVAAVLISFVLGIYVGGLGKVDNSVTTAKSESSDNKSTHVTPRPARSESRHRHVRKAVAKRPEPARSTAGQKQTLTPAENSDENADSLASNQFSGKDISFDSAAPTGEQQDQDAATTSSVEPSSTAGQDTAQDTMTGESSTAANSNGTQTSATQTSTQGNDAVFKHLLDLNVTYFNQKKWQQVVDTSQQILALKPFTEAALINRSAAYTELGQFDLAIEDTNTLIRINRKDGVAYNNRAYAYEKWGEIEKAVADYTIACQLGIKQSCNDMQRLKKVLSQSK